MVRSIRDAWRLRDGEPRFWPLVVSITGVVSVLFQGYLTTLSRIGFAALLGLGIYVTVWRFQVLRHRSRNKSSGRFDLFFFVCPLLVSVTIGGLVVCSRQQSHQHRTPKSSRPRVPIAHESPRPQSTPSKPLGRYLGGTQPVADNNDPKKTRCAYDPDVATLDRAELNTSYEHYLGEAQLRYSPRCQVAWGRFDPGKGMNYLRNAKVMITAIRPTTSTTGIPYETRFDGQAVFGNILLQRDGCVMVNVVVRSSNGSAAGSTDCKP